MLYLEPASTLYKTKEMKLRFYICVLVSVFCIGNLQAQTKRFDTSMKIGRAGYKVYCPNKNLDKNPVTIGAARVLKKALPRLNILRRWGKRILKLSGFGRKEPAMSDVRLRYTKKEKGAE